MAEFHPRALHLHTLDSLLADLVSGRAAAVGDGTSFVLPDERTRSALQWYRERGATNWPANVTAPQGEALVDAILKAPPEVAPLPARGARASTRRLTLKKLVAHRFAGLHKFGTLDAAPENYVHEFSPHLTLFEGRNGSGKTSLANAVIWTLTGELLRPQREPETATEEFQCHVEAADGGESTEHRLTPVTPMPDVADFRPERDWIPTDTWVEITFEDENGVLLPPIRRSQSRSVLGKIVETAPDLSALELDPISIRIGTVMPGLLPLIRVGSESELGLAVSQLTGLASLVDLSDHVRRMRQKIEKEFVKSKIEERTRIDTAYNAAKDDLATTLENHPGIAPPTQIPAPSDDECILATINQVSNHFETAKSAAFESARSILGNGFDPADLPSRSNLEKSIAPALSEVTQPNRLSSIVRLQGLAQLPVEQLDSAAAKLAELLAEGMALADLARDPSSAARARLYARVASWIADHPQNRYDDSACVVCGGSLNDALDPVTGKPVKQHLHDAQANAELLSQTLSRWSAAALGTLSSALPTALRSEIGAHLPTHPCDLLRTAIIDELLAHESFAGVLAPLKAETRKAYESVVKTQPELEAATTIKLTADCEPLAIALTALEVAVRFARWAKANEVFLQSVLTRVLGRRPKEGEPSEPTTLTGKLLSLEATVKAAKPLSDALTSCGRLKSQITLRRAADKRLAEYAIANEALVNLLALGVLADKQVEQLRKTLSTAAAVWRSRIYLGAFPSTAHELVDTAMGRKGELDLVVRTGGVSAPAQHVANASALRASLVGFYLAFWEHVLLERGGLRTLLLDDPQELLDDDNRERLAAALGTLVGTGAQVVVTSNDPRFSYYVAHARPAGEIEHLEVHPATSLHPTVRTTPPLTEIFARRKLLDADPNAEAPARDYADGCRVFLEGKLGDLFEDPAFSRWVKENPVPTLSAFVNRLRQNVNSGPQSMFNAPVFKSFVNHPALVDDSPVIRLMNKAHHGKRNEIRAADVAECAEALGELLKLAEEMHEECCRWRRRDPVPVPSVALPGAIAAMPVPEWNVVVCPDLAAFTRTSPASGSQGAVEPLDPALMSGKAVFCLRRDNFGFAARAGSLAIVTADPLPVKDRRLVIARHGQAVYARRLLRAQGSPMIGLTAEIPDPRTRSPKTIFLPESEVAVHQVVGIVLQHDILVGVGSDEAVLVDATDVLRRVELAFRVVDDSAVPLALPKQVVLGGPPIDLVDLGRCEEKLVALSLDDGSSILKRVGAHLPGELSHLRQFESIGGLGASQVLSVGREHPGILRVLYARLIVGVLYHG